LIASGYDEERGKEDGPKSINNNERDALVEGGPVDAVVGLKLLGEGVDARAAATNRFVGVHNTRLSRASEYVERISDHTF
jgi:hypothetical protein